MKKHHILSLAVFGALALTLCAQRIESPTPGGKIVSPDAQRHKFAVEEWHFAPARVEGNLVYVSGIVAGSRGGKTLDAAGLEAAFRRAWTRISATLEAAGSGTDCLVELTTFHVFKPELFAGTPDQHVDIFRKVKDEFVPAPYPAWTGIGVATLFAANGVVEIKVIARLRSPVDGK